MKLVVFDLDGTLLNTMVDLTNAMNVGLRAVNLPTISVSEFRDMVGKGTGRMAARACGQSSGRCTIHCTSIILCTICNTLPSILTHTVV